VLDDLKIHAGWVLSDEDKESINAFKCLDGTNTKNFNAQKKREELDKIENYKVQAFESYIDGLLTKAEYMQLKEKYEENAKAIQLELQENKSAGENKAQQRSFQRWLLALTDNFNVEHLTREMVLNLIEGIYIYEDNRIEINYKFRFDQKYAG
jgi:hypothetical protein